MLPSFVPFCVDVGATLTARSWLGSRVSVTCELDRMMGVAGAVVGAVVGTGVADTGVPVVDTTALSGPSCMRRSFVEIVGGCLESTENAEYECVLGPAMLDIWCPQQFCLFCSVDAVTLPSRRVSRDA